MAVKAMADNNPQVGDAEGFLWEIGDFLFAAKSIRKLVQGEGGWGDLANVGISAATLFLPLGKLGQLTSKGLQLAAKESAELLATDVVSVVGKKQLQKNIDHIDELLATAADDTTASVAARKAKADEISQRNLVLTKQGGVTKYSEMENLGPLEHPMPPQSTVKSEVKVPAPEETIYPQAISSGEPRDLSYWLSDSKKMEKYEEIKRKLGFKEITRADLTSEEEKLFDVISHYKNPKNQYQRTVTHNAGEADEYKTVETFYLPFKEAVEPEMYAGGAEWGSDFVSWFRQERGNIKRELKELNTYLRKAKEKATTRKIKYKDGKIVRDSDGNVEWDIFIDKDKLSNAARVVAVWRKDLVARGEKLTDLSKAYAQASKEENVDTSAIDLLDRVRTVLVTSEEKVAIRGKAKPYKSKKLTVKEKEFDEFQAQLRKQVDEWDEIETKKENKEPFDIISKSELEDVGIYGEDAKNVSPEYLEDVKSAPKRGSVDYNDTENVEDTLGLSDITAAADDTLMAEASISGRATVKELESDLIELRSRATRLSQKLKENPNLHKKDKIVRRGNEVRKVSGQDTIRKELADTNRQIKKAYSDLQIARGKGVKSRIDVVKDADQKMFLSRIKKAFSAKVSKAGAGTTGSRLWTLPGRTMHIQGIITNPSRQDALIASMIKKGQTREQAIKVIQKYKDEYEQLSNRLQSVEKTITDNFEKLDDVTKQKIVSSFLNMSRLSFRKNFEKLNFENYESEFWYLRQIKKIVDDPEFDKKVQAILRERKNFWENKPKRKDLVDGLMRPVKREQLSDARIKDLEKTKREVGSSTTKTIERNVSVRRSEAIANSPDRALDDEILVFGSNLEGRHGAGAALEAKNRFGAKYGQARGPQGNAYAIATKDLKTGKGLDLSDIKKEIDDFLDYADANPDKKFFFSAIGTGRAGHTPEDIANLISRKPDNVRFDPKIGELIKKNPIDELEEEITNWQNYLLGELYSKGSDYSPAEAKALTQEVESKIKTLKGELEKLKNSSTTSKNSSTTSNVVIHSGLAKGADTAWAEAADKAGIKTIGHSFKGHKGQGTRPALETRNELTESQLKEADSHLKKANEVLKRPTARMEEYVRNLLRRNYYQIKDSEAVIAVGRILPGGKIVDGGTGWATQMGIDMGKPVYVFDQEVGSWAKWNGERFVKSELPPKFKSFAGIGTRNLKPSGRKAINDYIEHLSGKKVVAAEGKAEAITSFRDKHRFLSNMSPSSITIEGIRYPTVEHAFQAAKTTDKELRKKIARAANPKEAKRMGRELDLRSDWNDIRVKAMEYILRKKFEDPKLRKQLLETGESKLIEGNTWGDKFWGQVDGEGKNMLGELLMKIRKELMEGK